LINEGDSINSFFGGYIFLGVNSFGYIERSLFSKGEAYNGGAIYVSSEAKLLVNSTIFENNYAKKYGGAIYAQASFDISIY
jgi:predicted outer membrane repeat protein